jgi:hypothetical protein
MTIEESDPPQPTFREVALPVHLAFEGPNAGLAVDLNEQAKPGFNRCSFRSKASGF